MRVGGDNRLSPPDRITNGGDKGSIITVGCWTHFQHQWVIRPVLITTSLPAHITNWRIGRENHHWRDFNKSSGESAVGHDLSVVVRLCSISKTEILARSIGTFEDVVTIAFDEDMSKT